MKQGNRRKGQEERRQENRDITVAAAYEEVFKPRLAGYSGETAEFYDYAVGTFARWWGGRSLAELTKEDVYRYFAWLRTKSLSPASLNTLGRGLKTFIVYLEEEGYVEGSFARFELPRWPKVLPKILTDAQVKALLRAADRRTWEGVRNYTIVLTILDTGLRRQEVIDLEIQDIDLASGMVVVR